MNKSQRTLLLGITVGAGALLLAGCAAPVPTGSGASTPAGSSATAAAAGGAASTGGSSSSGGSAATGDAACKAVPTALLKSLVNVPIGQPYNQLAGDPNDFACIYGIGSNASLTGSAIVSTNNDTILVTKFGALGKNQYEHSISVVPSGQLVSYPGLGDKASWWNEFGQGPHLFSYKGNVGCEVAMTLADMSEVGVTATGGMSAMADSDAAIVVKREAPICAAILG